MSAALVSFFAPDRRVAGCDALPRSLSSKSARRDPMHQPQFLRSNTFRWALAVAGMLALLVIVLLGFIYWQTDNYLVARSDTAVATQLNFIAGLSNERRLEAIDQDLKQDARGVHYAGLFGADGRKIAGNLVRFPPELKMNDSVHGISVVRMLAAAPETRVIRAIARRMPNGEALVIGRDVDEAREISHVVGQALALG